MNTLNKILIARDSLASTITALHSLIKDCAPDELLGARAIAENLIDVEQQMVLLGARMRQRLADGH
jgi:hypothetical protein